ncbi:MAG: MerR family transcriptional regulator [Deltaproteobacteria bacterium]|nr:MerR family transcriptional regulator [Deltaproteobacteria bacterium]
MEFSILTEIPLSTAEPETEIEVKAEADTEPEPEAREVLASESIPLTISEPISLPAALCDDLLLEEISAIPDKMGFKIGEVSDLLGIKQYVLRYWESEFEVLKPKKAHNNQRLFTKKNVENAFLIRKLLHRDRFSIEGARVALRGLKAHVKKEHQKEKEIKQAFHKMDTYHDRLENIALDIRKLRQLFK